MAVEIFECKVDAVLNCGRWLYALTPSAQRVLDQELEGWARLLLGAPSWRNGAVCCCETGLLLTGFGRAVRSVAFRRARAWAMQSGDWYKQFFTHNNHIGCGLASASLAILESWGIVDWPSCATSHTTLESYQSYVDQILLGKCLEVRCGQLLSHKASVPYYTFQPNPGDLISICRSLHLSWRTQISLRVCCRVRAGIACFSSVFGKPSRADRPSPNQVCIFCGAGIRRNATKYAIGVCTVWLQLRAQFSTVCNLVGASADELCMSIMKVQLGQAGFVEAVELLSTIDDAATIHWNSRT